MNPGGLNHMSYGDLVTPVHVNNWIDNIIAGVTQTIDVYTLPGQPAQNKLQIPVGYGHLVVRVRPTDPASAVAINGITAGYDGQRLTILNWGVAPIHLINQFPSPAAHERLKTGVYGDRWLMPPNTADGSTGFGAATFIYMSGEGWLLETCRQGRAYHSAYQSSDYTTNIASTWNVESGDIVDQSWHLEGNMLTAHVNIDTSTLVTAPGNVLSLRVRIAGGHQSKSVSSAPCYLNNFYSGLNHHVIGLASVSPAWLGYINIAFLPDSSGFPVWQATANGTYIQVVLPFEVR